VGRRGLLARIDRVLGRILDDRAESLDVGREQVDLVLLPSDDRVQIFDRSVLIQHPALELLETIFNRVGFQFFGHTS